MKRENVQYLKERLIQKCEFVKYISKINNSASLKNYSDLIDETDGILIEREELGLDIGFEKITLAQHILMTQSNLKGKLVILGGHILESMSSASALMPTRAETTDIANSVLDGIDCLLIQISQNQNYLKTILTAMAIAKNAEQAINYKASQSLTLESSFLERPLMTLEAAAAGIARAAIDGDVGLCLTISTKGLAANLVTKYRPPQVQVVVTSDVHVMRQSRMYFGQRAYLVDAYDKERKELVKDVVKWMKECCGVDVSGQNVACLHGSTGTCADEDPIVTVLDANKI